MSNDGFDRWDYLFEGAYTDPNRLRDVAGVYVIWCKSDNQWTILDVGESDDVRNRINNHERADCWEDNCSGTIYYSATYISSPQERSNLEQRIRNTENVSCGER